MTAIIYILALIGAVTVVSKRKRFGPWMRENFQFTSVWLCQAR